MSKGERRARKQRNKELAQQQRYASWRRSRRRRLLTILLVWGVIIAMVATFATFLIGGGNELATPELDDPPEPTTTTLPPELAAVECTEDPPPGADEEKPSFDEPESVIDPERVYQAVIETSCGTLVAELDPSDPFVSEAGVNNFLFLAGQGFYDGLTFHRVIPEFVIQGGDPLGNGTGGPGYQFGSDDDVPDDLTYQIGDLVYANSGAPSTSGSQFFIVTGPSGTQLPPAFIKFGTILEGTEIAQRISFLQDAERTAPDGTLSPPIHPVYIVSVTIDP